MKEPKIELLGYWPGKRWKQARAVFDGGGLSPTLTAEMGGHGNNYVYVAEHATTPLFMESIKEENMLRIRKLTEAECMRLMGFEEKDTEACRKAGLSASNIYHQSGDSIISTVLVALFGELIGADYRKAIEGYADKLHSEVEE